MSSRMTKKRVIVVALVLLLGIVAWRLLRPDPQLAKARKLRQELFSEEARKLPREERRRKWQEFAQAQEKLTPEQRRELWSDMRREREKEIEHYFSLSKEEKVRWLDQQIDRMEARRKAWQARRRASGGSGAPGARGAPGAGRTNVSGPGAGQGGGPRRRGWGNLSSEERERRRRQRLDQTTPEQRARFDQLRRDMAARRAQRGLPPLGRGFGRPR